APRVQTPSQPLLAPQALPAQLRWHAPTPQTFACPPPPQSRPIVHPPQSTRWPHASSISPQWPRQVSPPCNAHPPPSADPGSPASSGEAASLNEAQAPRATVRTNARAQRTAKNLKAGGNLAPGQKSAHWPTRLGHVACLAAPRPPKKPVESKAMGAP